MTALILAAKNGHTDIVIALLRKRVDLELKSE